MIATATEPTLWHKFDRGNGQAVDIPIYYVTKAEQIPDFLTWARQHRTLLVDVETDGKSSDGLNWASKVIATVQIGTPHGKDPRAYVFCVASLGDDILPVVRLVEDPDILWLGQNIRFECRFMGYKWALNWRRVACTQVNEMVIRAGLFQTSKGGGDDGQGRAVYGASSMKALAMRYLGVELDKGEDVRLTFWRDDKGVIRKPGTLSKRHLIYAAGDVVYPWWIALEQKPEIMNRGLKSIVEIESELIPILADSEMVGIGIDQEAWKELIADAEIAEARAIEQLDQLLLRVSAQTDLFGRSGQLGPKERPTLTVNGRVREINYNAPDQAKRAIANYCRSINWPLEIVTTLSRLTQLKRQYGQEWMAKKELDPKLPESVEQVPDWVIPETQYLVLLSAEATDLWVARLRGYLPAEIIEPYLEYKEASKRIGTYGLKFLKHVKADGRIHTEWHQVLTSTGRLSSEPNLQNIPKDPRYRKCFVPTEGCKFIIYDFSQIEPRLSAQVSGDPLYCKTFNEYADIYVRIMEAMTGQVIDRSTEIGAQLRQGGKVVVLSTAYNAGVNSLRTQLTLNLERFILSGAVKPPTLDYAAEQLKGYFRVAPGIKLFQEACVEHASPLTGPKIWDRYLGAEVTYATAPCGRKRFFPPDVKNVYTEAPNAPIQGCSATITKLATILLWRACRELGITIHFVNYMHDELIVEVEDQYAEQVGELLKNCMEDAGRRYITKVPVIASANGTGIWDYWHKEL